MCNIAKKFKTYSMISNFDKKNLQNTPYQFYKLHFSMFSEELFEIDKKIAQIRSNIQRRKDKIAQWVMPVDKVIERKQTIHNYMDLSSSAQKLLGKPIAFLTQEQKKQKAEQLNVMVNISRSKIRNHYNELKQLQQLIEKRNKIRIHKSNLQATNECSEDKQNKRERIQHQEKSHYQNSCNNQNAQMRTIKDRVNPFQNIKVQKLLDYYELVKKQDIPNKTFPGIGLDNTFYSHNLRKQQRKEEKKPINQQKKLCSKSIVKQFEHAFKYNNKSLSYKHSNKLFEDRMKKILQYHGRFWQQQLKLIEDQEENNNRI